MFADKATSEHCFYLHLPHRDISLQSIRQTRNIINPTLCVSTDFRLRIIQAAQHSHDLIGIFNTLFEFDKKLSKHCPALSLPHALELSTSHETVTTTKPTELGIFKMARFNQLFILAILAVGFASGLEVNVVGARTQPEKNPVVSRGIGHRVYNKFGTFICACSRCAWCVLNETRLRMLCSHTLLHTAFVFMCLQVIK